MWADVDERLHCENLPCGRFNSAAWWREMQDVMRQHFISCSRNNELFHALYPRLLAEARAAGAVRSRSEDSEGEKKEVWAWLREASKLPRQKRVAKTKTWFQPFEAITLGLKTHTAYLYVLCVLCKVQGHFKSLGDMPVHGGALEPALVQELPGDAILSRKRPGRQHTVKLSALKARCANNCVAACHLQGSGDGQQRADIILTLSEPAWRSWGNDYKYPDEPRQVKLKHMNCARWGFHP